MAARLGGGRGDGRWEGRQRDGVWERGEGERKGNESGRQGRREEGEGVRKWIVGEGREEKG